MAIDKNRALETAKRGAAVEAEAVARVSGQIDSTMIDAIDIIEATDGKVIVIGSGTSGTIARRMAHLLSVSGTPSLFVHPMDGLHGTMGAIEADDVVIALSKGGESDELNELCALQKEKGSKIIGIGESPESTLAGLADVYITLKTIDEADPENTLAMGSTLVVAAWGDALARALMEIHGWDVSESLRLHPAGAVGKRAAQQMSRGAR